VTWVLWVAGELAGVGLAVGAWRWAWRGWKKAGQVIKDAQQTGDDDE
jgi:hypothetical protein